MTEERFEEMKAMIEGLKAGTVPFTIFGNNCTNLAKALMEKAAEGTEHEQTVKDMDIYLTVMKLMPKQLRKISKSVQDHTPEKLGNGLKTVKDTVTRGITSVPLAVLGGTKGYHIDGNDEEMGVTLRTAKDVLSTNTELAHPRALGLWCRHQISYLDWDYIGLLET